MFSPLALTAAPLALIATSAAPITAPIEEKTDRITAAAALLALEGEWDGKLTYRDYQSQELESIPVAVSMEALPDGQTMVQRYDYTDPGFQVYITNLIAVKDGLLTGATARAGRAFETYKKDITVTAAIDAASWTAVLTSEMQDDGRPSQVRETMVRDGDNLTVLKEVDYLDDDKEDWIFRNTITLSASR